MTTTQELIAELWASDAASELTNRAARHIESLSAEVERLKVLSAKSLRDADKHLSNLVDMSRERDQLRAQIEAQGEVVGFITEFTDIEGGPTIKFWEGQKLTDTENIKHTKVYTHPAPAAPVVEPQWFAELLRRAMPYVKEASVRYYDGTDGHSYRQSASGLLKKMDAVLHPTQPKGEKA